jgi:hypothetical protein
MTRPAIPDPLQLDFAMRTVDSAQIDAGFSLTAVTATPSAAPRFLV